MDILTNLKFRDADELEPGITWIEMYLLTEAVSRGISPASIVNAMPVKAIGKALTRFRIAVINIIKIGMKADLLQRFALVLEVLVVFWVLVL